ncbi:MOSC domain-containing protein [Streptomyces sp. NPDC026673]|uniref:MOSC domain-containing protein n=1 Tax=Streptomyces sp. NPDC026673 TaxID=3155724 RepID=UPI0033FE2EE2
MATLTSVNVGKPKDVSWGGRTVRTGAWKAPVDGPRMVRRLNVEGDGQGDLQGHGGEHRAVLVYQVESYRHWRRHLGRDDHASGDFGENFTVDGLADEEVCIGDRYRIGEAEFEVTQPRVTCYRLGLRLGEPAMPSLLVAHRRPGFYLRVVTEGRVEAGDEIIRTRTGPGALSVADADALLYLPGRDPAKLRTALTLTALSPGWRRSFQEMAAARDGTSAASRETRPPAWQGFRPLRVTRVVRETATVSSFHLEAPDGRPLPTPQAGQYLTLRVADGPAALVRSYSLSSAPGARDYRISVKREAHGRAGTYLHTRIHPGATLEAAAPRGDFVLTEGTAPVALISAGVGITPVLAMLHQLSSRRSARPVWWIHTARDPGAYAFADEARRLLAALPHAHEHIHYTRTEPGGARGPSDTDGRLTPSAFARFGIPADADAYVCGPAPFSEFVRQVLTTRLGLSVDRVRTELFGALDPLNPGVTGAKRSVPHQPPGPAGHGPLVTFTRSGVSTRWDPRHGTLLELAEACAIPTRWACRAGVCHTCVTPVVSGRVRYERPPLEPPAGDEVLICRAVPATDMLLEL